MTRLREVGGDIFQQDQSVFALVPRSSQRASLTDFVARPEASASDVAALAAFGWVLGHYTAGDAGVVALPAGRFLRVSSASDQTTASLLAAAAAALAGETAPAGCAHGVSVDERVTTFGFAGGAELSDDCGLDLSIAEEAGHVGLVFTYDPVQFPEARVRQIARQVVRTIPQLASVPAARLGDVAVLSAEERWEVVRHFNDTATEHPTGLTLHGLVHAQTMRSPDAVAAVSGSASLTYRELDEQAGQIAHVLHHVYGVRPGDVVGIMVGRSAKLPVGLLGILKTGAAYLPINPRHPWALASYMLDNAGATVLVADTESIPAAALFPGQLCVLDLELRPRGPSLEAMAPDAADGLAYVIYTSGSTGRPKGIAVEHRAIINTVLWRNAAYSFGPADVNLQIPSFAFDSSVIDIFCALSVGARLVIPAEDVRLDARRLREECVRHGVTTCIVTPSYYRVLTGELAAVSTLRAMTIAGESVTPDLVAEHLERLPGVMLMNEYGPTEASVCATACRLDAVEPAVSIGRPIANAHVLILDARQRVCGVEMPGEMYLGGAGLARGYVNQPVLTEERFVPSPVPDIYPGRLYRTGDRACWRADGRIEFLGRVDDQVKVRGFRIELDDVSSAIAALQGVRHAAVVCKTDPTGARYLAAYVEADAGVTDVAVRQHLQQQLPEYMVPDVIRMRSRLPLTLNGKVDRSALAEIDDFAAHESGPAAEPSPLEQGLLAAVAAVLNRPGVVVDDNFFGLGGNSLRVMELTSRIRGDLAIEVDLMDVYAFPTVRELAHRLTATGLASAGGNPLAPQPRDSE